MRERARRVRAPNAGPEHASVRARPTSMIATQLFVVPRSHPMMGPVTFPVDMVRRDVNSDDDDAGSLSPRRASAAAAMTR